MSSLEAELDALSGGNDPEASVSMWLDTGFKPLNYIISGDFDGGMPAGRIVEMFGGESCGKTAIATCVMASAQKAGGIAIFMDHENSFEEKHAIGLGLDTGGKYIFKRPTTFEQSIDLVVKVITGVREKKLIPDDAPIVAVFDSLASMVPASKFAKENAEQSMHDKLALASSTSAAFPALNQFASMTNTLCLFLNQEREKPGVAFGDPTTTPGGKAPKFYSSVRIQLGRQRIMEERTVPGGKKKKIFVGQNISVKVLKNKVSRPFLETDYQFRFREDGSGYFDVIGSSIDYLVGMGKITKKGNRIEFDDKTYSRKQLVVKIEKEGRQEEILSMIN